MIGHLPSLNALRGFEAAARLSSFSKAAEELEMTQSAVSHHVRTLETHLEQSLFHRINRTVVLTDAGSDFLITVQTCLRSLGAGIRRLEQYKKPNQLIVSTTHAIASRWLLPRLAAFREHYPAIDVWLYTTEDAVNWEQAEVDFHLHFGLGQYPELWSAELFGERLIPLCAPAMAKRLGTQATPQELVSQVLLHDERHENWASWFESVGEPHLNPVVGPNFSDSGLMLDAAVQGQGIALAGVSLAAQLVRDGMLVAPIARSMPVVGHYCLSASFAGIKRTINGNFRDWLLQEASQFRCNYAAELTLGMGPG